MPSLIKNQAFTLSVFPFVSGAAYTGSTPPTIYLSKDSAAQVLAANQAIHNGNGEWLIALTASEMNCSKLVVIAVAGGATAYQITLLPESYYTPERAVLLDNIASSAATAMAVWNFNGQRTLTAFGTLVSDIVNGIWSLPTATVTALGGIGKWIIDNVTAIKGRTDNLTPQTVAAATRAELAPELGTLGLVAGALVAPTAPQVNLSVQFRFASTAAMNALRANLKNVDNLQVFDGDGVVLLGFEKVGMGRIIGGNSSVYTGLVINVYGFFDTDGTQMPVGAVRSQEHLRLYFATSDSPNESFCASAKMANAARDTWARVVVPNGTASGATLPATVTLDTTDNGQTVIVTYGGALTAAPQYDPSNRVIPTPDEIALRVLSYSQTRETAIPQTARLRSVDGSPVGVVSLTAGDTTPPLLFQVVDSAGEPVDLSGCHATFHMVPRRAGSTGQNGVSSGHTVSGDAVIPAASAGYLSYDWATDGSDTVAGSYLGRFTITDGDGNKITLPSAGGVPVEIS